jgi:electron transfer flavoprotein alpha/beta subunit
VEILVCVRRVPDTSENEIELNRAGNDIERDELVYSINEADNYAVEEALQIAARVGGTSRSPRWVAKMTRRSCAARWPWARTAAC